MRDPVKEILTHMLTLWELKKEHYAGIHEVNLVGGKTKKELMVNAFANFFNCEIIDTSVGGNMSALFTCTDEELADDLKKQISVLEKKTMTTPADYINLGYLIAKYEGLLTWRVELEPLPDNRWSLRWGGWNDNINGEETTKGTAEELVQLMKKAIKELEPEGVVFDKDG